MYYKKQEKKAGRTGGTLQKETEKEQKRKGWMDGW